LTGKRIIARPKAEQPFKAKLKNRPVEFGVRLVVGWMNMGSEEDTKEIGQISGVNPPKAGERSSSIRIGRSPLIDN